MLLKKLAERKDVHSRLVQLVRTVLIQNSSHWFESSIGSNTLRNGHLNFSYSYPKSPPSEAGQSGDAAELEDAKAKYLNR